MDRAEGGALVERYPDLPIDHDNRRIYEGWLERRLLINRCEDCGCWHQPPRGVCPACWSFAIEPREVSGRGAVFTATLLRQGWSSEAFSYPHPVVVIELTEQAGLRVTSTVVRCEFDAIRVGLPVELDWVDRSGAPYPAFRLR